MKKLTLLFYLLLGLTFKAFSCGCIISELEEMQKKSLEYSEFIFLGEVISRDADGTFKFRVIETFKGDKNLKEIEGEIKTSCSFSPNMGEGKWIVYGNLENGKIDLSQCGITRSYSNPHMIMTSTYSPPPLKATEDEYQQHVDKIRKMAQADWRDELKRLREHKN